MPNLPEITDFDETAFPGLVHIFREVDCAIAAIIASDPAFRVKRASHRRKPAPGTPTATVVRRRSARQAAA